MHQKSYNVNLKIIIRYLQAIIKYWKLHAIMKHKTFFNCKKNPFSKMHAVHTKRAIITYKSFVHLAFNNSIQLKWLEYKFTLNTFFPLNSNATYVSVCSSCLICSNCLILVHNTRHLTHLKYNVSYKNKYLLKYLNLL